MSIECTQINIEQFGRAIDIEIARRHTIKTVIVFAFVARSGTGDDKKHMRLAHRLFDARNEFCNGLVDLLINQLFGLVLLPQRFVIIQSRRERDSEQIGDVVLAHSLLVDNVDSLVSDVNIGDC